MMNAIRYAYLICTCLPYFTLLLFLIFWMTASAILGHAPMPSWNDPKDLGLGFLYIPTMFLILTSLYWIPVWLILFFLVRKQLDKPAQVKTIFTFASGCVLFFLIYYFDPLEVLSWFFD